MWYYSNDIVMKGFNLAATKENNPYKVAFNELSCKVLLAK